MRNWASNPWTQVAAIPFFLMVIGVMARRLGRADRDSSPRRNDLAVGTTLLLMSLGTILGDIHGSTPETLPKLLIWLVGVLAAAWISVDHDRSNSWVRNEEGLPTNQKRIFLGIILPDVVCFTVFAAYQAYKVDLL